MVSVIDLSIPCLQQIPSELHILAKKTDNELTTKKGGGPIKIPRRYPTIDLPTGKNLTMANRDELRKLFVLNRWWEESDMDAEDLAQSALDAIDDWLDEEIVVLNRRRDSYQEILVFGRVAQHRFCDAVIGFSLR